jgi:hypothetical protein
MKQTNVQDYIISESGISRPAKQKSKDPVVICPTPIYCVESNSDLRGTAKLTVRWRTNGGTEYQEDLPLTTLADIRAVARWLYLNGIAGFNPGEMKRYFEACFMALERNKE